MMAQDNTGQVFGAETVQSPLVLNTLRGRMNAGEQYGPWSPVRVSALG